VTAVVVPRPGREPAASALVEHARGQLAGYKCPRRVAFIRDEEMPRTATGKILHRVLRERFAG
jgi:fatty-acyl-CoA synthase